MRSVMTVFARRHGPASVALEPATSATLEQHLVCGFPGGPLLEFFSVANRAATPDPQLDPMDYTTLSDDELLPRLQAGDTRAFRCLYDRYYGLILYVARRCGMDGMEAEDILQDTFLKLLQKAGTLRDATAIKSWLISTARNQAMDILRRRQTTRSKNEALAASTPVDDGLAPASYVRELEVALVGNLIRQLAAASGDDVLVLFYIEGRSAQQIADLWNAPVSTVTNRLSRARRRFHEFFAGHLQQLRDDLP